MPANIINCERVSHPPLRFIGKRYVNAHPNWNDFWENNWFAEIEKAGERAAINDGSYCVLVGTADDGLEFYLGEFFPEGTSVPEGFDYADLPAMEAGLAYIYGQLNEVYFPTSLNGREMLQAAFAEHGIVLPDSTAQKRWLSFERDNCPRFTDPDPNGNIILDYAVYLD